MANRLMTTAEVCADLWKFALNEVGGDERAAKIMLCMMSPMVQGPPKAERDYLTSVLDKLAKEKP